MTPQGVEQSDSGFPASIVPSLPPVSPPSSPPIKQRRSFRARCGGAFRFLLRRPGRTAAVVGLALLIAAGVWTIGVYVWGHFQLQDARFAVEHYHNRPAQVYLQAYLKVWPNDPTALLLSARTARRLGAFPEAEGFLDRYAAVRGKDDDDLILERVLLQAQCGRVDEVRDFCEARVQQGDPSAPLILEAQAAGLMRVYRMSEAADRLETWLKLRPDDCQALLLRGIMLQLRNGLVPAAADFRRVVELDPDNEEARLRLSALLMQQHEPSEAFPHLEYLRKAMPDDPRILVRIAQCRLEMGQSDEARKTLDGVLARWPHFPDALAARGALAKQEGQPAQAESWLREAVARDPGAHQRRYQLYLCLAAEHKDAEAKEEKAQLDQLEADLKEIEKLVNGGMEQAGDDPAPRCRAGVIALRAGEAEEGVRWLESALELDPDYAPAHQALAVYYEQIGDRSRAAQHRAKVKP